MTRARVLGAAMVATAMTAALGAVAAPASAERSLSAAATVAPAAKPKPKPEPKPAFNPRTGVRLNNPWGTGKARYRGYSQVFKSIENSRYPAHIDVATWNFDSGRLVNALIAAHKRGVRVRLIMQDKMALQQSRTTGSYWRLKAGLAQPRTKAKREDVGKSWTRTCQSSCRGYGGILHSKFYLFSKVSSTPNVVVLSSGNLTEFAATIQWNDTYTVANHKKIYNTYERVFRQMARDKRASPPFREIRHDSKFTSIILPYQGKNTPSDPVLLRLKGIKCTGATGGAGDAAGRTVIRIAQTAWMDERGELIAKRIKTLHDQGCNVKIIYAVMTNRVSKVLDAMGPRGAVPRRQLTEDSDKDGFYDRYLHMKVLTVDGVRGKNRSTHIVWNGSENWNKVSLNSDEAGFRIVGEHLVHKYNKWIDWLYQRAPKEPGDPPPPPEDARKLGEQDPYKYVEIY